MKKILLVEDDLILGESLKEMLEDEIFEVIWVKDGNEAIEESYISSFDLFLFDVNVPFINGFELLKSLRESGDKTPAIFITARVDIESLTKGFDVGADDYIKKPFDIDELFVRINAMLKKSFKSYKNVVEYGDIKYDIKKQQVYKQGKLVNLTPNELKLFEFFLKNIGNKIFKEDILYYLHNGDVGSENALRVYISRLKKVGLKITNQRGVGYCCEKI